MLTIDAMRVLLGALLLTLGRRLYWLFVGAMGFVVGMLGTARFLPSLPDDQAIVAAVITAVVFAAMAVSIRRVGVAASGFLAGGYYLVQLVAYGGGAGIVPAGGGQIVVFLVGGLIGAVLMSFLFGWTLIVLSALGGAALICKSVHASPPVVSAVFTLLAIVGIGLQSGLIRRRRGQNPR